MHELDAGSLAGHSRPRGSRALTPRLGRAHGPAPTLAHISRHRVGCFLAGVSVFSARFQALKAKNTVACSTQCRTWHAASAQACARTKALRAAGTGEESWRTRLGQHPNRCTRWAQRNYNHNKLLIQCEQQGRVRDILKGGQKDRRNSKMKLQPEGRAKERRPWS